MSKKRTIEFVREEFEKERYELLTEEYVSAHSKLEYICSFGHNGEITWNSWSKGHRCLECSGSKKFDIDFARREFEKERYELLTEEYYNNNQELEYICPKGHKGKIRFYKWRIGHRCIKCGGTKKLTIEYIKQKTKEIAFGYECLSNEYLNNCTKLKFRCKHGHIFYMSWKDFLRGVRCPECWAINNCGEGNPNWKGGIAAEPYCDIWLDKDFKESIKKRDGYKCLNPDCWKTTDKLCVMHIDNNKKNCHPSNLITGCFSCNSRAQKDEDWWTSWYQAIIYRRYEYK